MNNLSVFSDGAQEDAPYSPMVHHENGARLEQVDLGPSHAEIRRLYRYDSETGQLYRLKAGGHFKPVGCVDYKGYIRVHLNGKCYRAHRLIWFLVTGAWPSKDIDHLDNDRGNNRWLNLREADVTTNNQNRRSASRASKSGVLGVSWSAKGKAWRAQIKINGRPKHLGTFRDIGEAERAYLAAKREAHSGCTL